MRGTLLLATWFGAGRVPKAPGTAGTIAAMPLYLAAWVLHAPVLAIPALALVMTAVAIPISGAAAKLLGSRDPEVVVIDEVAGFLVAASFGPLVRLSPGEGPYDVATLFGAVALFRFFDIAKPGPIRALQDLPGGYGIVLDDVLAGVAAGLCLVAVRALLVLTLSGRPPW